MIHETGVVGDPNFVWDSEQQRYVRREIPEGDVRREIPEWDAKLIDGAGEAAVVQYGFPGLSVRPKNPFDNPATRVLIAIVVGGLAIQFFRRSKG